MTSSNTLKKIISIGAAALLAIGGSLVAAEPALAVVALGSGPVVTPSGGIVSTATSLSATSYATFTGVPNNYGGGGGTVIGWRVCDVAPSTTSSFDGLDVPAAWNCQDVYTTLGRATGTSLTIGGITALGSAGSTVSVASLVGKYIVRFEMSKNVTNSTIYGWAMSSPKLIAAAPTITGTSGNLNGTVGTALTMPAYTTSGLTSPVVFSYTTAGSVALPAGVTFDTNTGQLLGTPTASASNLMVTVTATGANSLSISSVFNFTVVSGGGGGGGGGGQTFCSGQTSITSFAASASTVSPGGSFTQIYNGIPSLGNCALPVNGFAAARFINGVLLGSFYYLGSSQSLYLTTSYPITYTQLQTQAGRPLVDGDVYTSKIWVNPGNTQPSPTSPGDFSYTVTITGVGAASAAPVLSPEQAKNQIKPLPVIVQPLVAALPALNKPLVDAGGKVALTAGDFTGLVSASISGKPLDLTVGSTGGLTITVPNGKAGTTADLLLNFKAGTVILQDAIKYVAPVVVADVPTRPVSIAAGSTKLSQETADQVRQAAFANMKNTAVSCVAYAANGTAAAKAAALATAQQVCALATKSNPDLTATPVTVIVNKAKAKTEAVGIKVYKN